MALFKALQGKDPSQFSYLTHPDDVPDLQSVSNSLVSKKKFTFRFKAINMVLAFVSSKRQLATSFSAVRSSVEGLLKHPLEIVKVSEIKALLPDLVKFSYIPLSELQVNEENSKKPSARSIDYSKATLPESSGSQEGHILVLDFVDTLRGRKSGTSSQSLSISTPSLSPAAVKKLIEARNQRFQQAVNELLSATPVGDDPVHLLVTAGQTYVPVNHTIFDSDEEPKMIPNSNERPPVDQVISDIMASIWYKDQIVHRRIVEAKEAQTAPLNPPISQKISNAVLTSRKIRSLYSHQVAAIDAIRRGKHVVVSTSTASGKSVIYQIPLLMSLEEDSDARAILVFPTKALAQDQKASLERLFQMCPGLDHLKVVATYDGDTPQETRAEIRDTASVILTNFDTLHASILPNEEKWRSFLKRLKILAVDELHYYTGLFGSHVAYILRRFRRVCAAVGNRRIRFISCSATLANPAEYMCKIFALDVDDLQVVSNDGAPSGSKEYLVWNPPLVDVMDPSLGRRSSLSEASRLMCFLMKRGVRVILFCKIRKVCELAMKTIKADLSNEGRLDILERVRAYRGGKIRSTRYDRRKIEHEAFSGQLLGIVATNALELGIDIGVLDAVIMLGFPLTVSNFKQQAGRAGRRSQDSLAVLVADPFPIDQHFVNYPSELFENSLDDLVIDVDNELILEAHLQCAGYEIPLTAEDEKWFGSSMMDICEKKLKKDADGWYHTNPKYLPFPSRHVSIRGAQEDTYMVVEVKDNQTQKETHMLEEVEFSRALFELYEGGVFMHQGETFIVKEISHDEKVAKVVRTDLNYITSPRHLTEFPAVSNHCRHSVQCLSIIISFNLAVIGFFKIRGKTILDAVELITPPWERETTGFWIDLPSTILESLSSKQIDGAAAIHAAEHAFLNQFVLSEDVKTDCRVAKEDYKDTDTPAKRPPRLIFYDAAGKTGGVVARAFDHVQNLLNRAQMAVENCSCAEGCTLCVQSTVCKDANLISSKLGASIILNGLLGVEHDLQEVDSVEHLISREMCHESEMGDL
ncbi:DEAD/H helicase [Flammula alnicola]|nr:DEAD/H helicase [Flammula alnicola]